MEQEKSLVSLRDLWESIDSPFKPVHFVNEPNCCSPDWAYLPWPEIPRHLMKEEDADRAQAALDICISFINPWLPKRTGTDDPEFIEASEAFTQITGVDVFDIFNIVSSRLLSQTDAH